MPGRRPPNNNNNDIIKKRNRRNDNTDNKRGGERKRRKEDSTFKDPWPIERPTTISEKKEKHPPVLGVFITCGKHMAKFFGLDDNESLLIGHHSRNGLAIPGRQHKLTPDFSKPEIDTLMVYSDIILPKINVGDSHTNILDIISTPHAQTFQRSNAVGLYRPLKNHTIKSVSIAIYDKDGDEVYFPKNSFTALELELRPVTLDL